MKVWLIVPYEPLPSIDKTGRYLRYGMLANELAKDKKNSTTFWTSDFDHIRKKNRYGYSSNQKVSDNLFLKLIYAKAYKKNISFDRIKHNILLAKKFKEFADIENELPDIIFACLPTLELAEEAVNYANRNNIPIIVDIVDVWPDVYLTAFPKIIKSIARVLLFSEYHRAKRILGNADSITAVSITYLDWALKILGRSKKDSDKTFPLGYKPNNFNLYEVETWEKKFKQDFNINKDSFVVTFIGQFEKSYDIETIVDAASRFLENKSVKFILAGNGGKFKRIQTLTKGQDNIFLTGWLNQFAISALLKISSIGLAAYTNSALQSLPYKPFEYMSAGLPILSSLKGEFKFILETQNIGRTYEASNVDSFVDQINWFINNTSSTREMGAKALELFHRDFNSDIIFPNIIKHMEKTITNHKFK